MNLADFFQNFFKELIQSYKLSFKKTYTVSLIFALFSIVGVCILMLPGSTAVLDSVKRHYFLDELFTNIYSNYDSLPGYQFSYFAYPLFLIFVSIFAIGFYRSRRSANLSLQTFISSIKLNDLGNIIMAGIIILIIDFLLYYLYGLLIKTLLDNYIKITLSYFRGFVPILILGIAVSRSLFGAELRTTFKSLFFTYFAFFIIAAIRHSFQYFFEVEIMWPFTWPILHNDKKYLVEIFLSIPLLASYFLAYTILLSFPLRIYWLNTVQETTDRDETEGNNTGLDSDIVE